MLKLDQRVARALRTLVPSGARVVAAVSGGPDSVAMTLLLRRLEGTTGSVALAGLAHFNHLLRGAEADADEAFCRDLARELDVPFVSDRCDVADRARHWKTSTEDAARRLRYDFLERARIELGADFVAVGHTRDDQAETWLMRLLRGAGPRGLAAIRRRKGTVIRPLLEIGRAELHAWLAGEGRTFRMDSTNEDVSIPRNRIRHEVLPAFERAAPGVADALARAAAIAAEDDDFLDDWATEEALRLVSRDEEGVLRVPVSGLRRLHPAIARRVIRDAMVKTASHRFIELKHVDAVLGLAASGRGRLDGPGQQVSVEPGGEWLRLEPEDPDADASNREAKSNVFRYPLSIPGEAQIPESGLAVSVEVLPTAGQLNRSATNEAQVAAAALLPGDLAVRNRRPGDRFRPLGLGGNKKLQDFFVDRKVPRAERDRVPLVVDSRDRIVWVVGHAVSQDFRVTDPGGAVLFFKVRHLGGTRV